MNTIKCSECGEEFAVLDDDILEMSCPYCNAKIKIAHISTVERVRTSWKKAYKKTTDFLKTHPKIARGLFIGAIAGLSIYTVKSEFDAMTSNMEVTNSQPTELPKPEYLTPTPPAEHVNTNTPVESVTYTDEEYHLLNKLSSGSLNGDFGEPLLDNGYGSSIQFEVREGVPMRVKCGPGGKFFNGEENETWESTPRVDTKWHTDDQKLFFLKKYGFLSDDEEVKAYSAKFKGKV